MSFLADRYLLFHLEGRKTDKVCTKYWQIEEAEIFLNNVLWASLKRK